MNSHHELQEIHKIDHKIIHLLQDRLKHSQRFYRAEAEEENIHPEIDKQVFKNLEKIEKLTEQELKMIKKMYKVLLKHESKKRKIVHKAKITEFKKLEKEKTELENRKKNIQKREYELRTA